MKLWGRFLAWRIRRRHGAHQRWLRRNRVVYATPHQDERDWTGAFMRSRKR